MSGPKSTRYDAAEARRRAAEQLRQQRLEAERRRQAEIEARERAKQEKIQREIEKRIQENESVRNSVKKAMDAERERLAKGLNADKRDVEIIKKSELLDENEVEKALDFEDLMQELQKDMSDPEITKEDIEEVLKDLVEMPTEAKSLLDVYDIQRAEESAQSMGVQKSDDEVKFEELLFKMEEEYQEIIADRAFFKQQKMRIFRFKEVCSCQKEYRSYKILRDVYYGEFKAIRDARKAWHEEYDKWKDEFYAVYSSYRDMCEIVQATPKFYRLNLNTVESDIAELKAETKRMEEKYIEAQSNLEVTRVLNEVMSEMGYEVLGTKTITKKSGEQVHNTVFSYGDGSGIHVMDNNGRVTMEIVGLEDGVRALSNEEKKYLVEEQEAFCDSFAEIEKEMAKYGVVVKDRIKKLAPSVEYSDILSMEGYTMTEKNVNTLSRRGEKDRVRRGRKPEYMSQE